MSTHCGICFGQGHREESCGSKPRVKENTTVKDCVKYVELLEGVLSLVRAMALDNDMPRREVNRRIDVMVAQIADSDERVRYMKVTSGT